MELRKSKLQQQNSFYLKYNVQGQTKLVYQDADFHSKDSYRQVHNIEHQSKKHQGASLYVDREYQINLGTEFEEDDTVIVRRLSTLYPPTNRPPFFNTEVDPSRPKVPTKVPHCLNQLPLFTTFHYKSLFITQDFQKSGKYILIINNDGRFEVISVDDFIPIHKDTLEPIWGMNYNNPWELILIKAWAKRLKGYNYIPQTKPFQFVESFSNPTWKYFNIGRSLEDFLKKYTDFKKLKNAKIILKSKNKEEIKENGILPNSCSYQLVGGSIDLKDNTRKYNLAIQSTTKSSWCGQLSYLDKKSVKTFHEINPEISFERGFMMSGQDLANNFAAAYVASKRQNGYFTGYKILQIADQEKKAQHFQFYMPSDGFVDFGIKQFPQNAINSAQSKIQGTNLSSNLRYLKNKHILVRDNHFESQGQEQFSYNYKPVSSKVTYSIENSNLEQASHHKFKLPRFTVYEIEYLKGYNRGQAHFVNLPRGRYILRFKSQLTNMPARYSINWVASSKIEFAPATITNQQKVELLHNSIVSIMHKQQHYSLEKGKKSEMISYGQTFEDIGYGFLAVKTAFDSPYDVIVEVHPEKLAQQGYVLKGRYKQEKEPFNIYIPPGQFDSIVLKLNKKATQYIWPTQAFKIWKKEAKVQDPILQANKGEEEDTKNPNLLHSETYKFNTVNGQKQTKFHSSIIQVKVEDQEDKPKEQPKQQSKEQPKQQPKEQPKVVEEQVDEWKQKAQIQ